MPIICIIDEYLETSYVYKQVRYYIHKMWAAEVQMSAFSYSAPDLRLESNPASDQVAGHEISTQ